MTAARWTGRCPGRATWPGAARPHATGLQNGRRHGAGWLRIHGARPGPPPCRGSPPRRSGWPRTASSAPRPASRWSPCAANAAAGPADWPGATADARVRPPCRPACRRPAASCATRPAPGHTPAYRSEDPSCRRAADATTAPAPIRVGRHRWPAGRVRSTRSGGRQWRRLAWKGVPKIGVSARQPDTSSILAQNTAHCMDRAARSAILGAFLAAERTDDLLASSTREGQNTRSTTP